MLEIWSVRDAPETLLCPEAPGAPITGLREDTDYIISCPERLTGSRLYIDDLELASGADGRYRGSTGVADAADIVRGRFTTSPPGTVTFAVDAGNQALLVGVKRDVLRRDMLQRTVRVVATVGTNTDWNDVAPAEGAALLDLP